MNFTCNECNDTGSRDKLGTYLDCNACGTAATRRDLNDFVKSLGPTHPEDVALAIHQRALAMAPKQEAPNNKPVSWLCTDLDGHGDVGFTKEIAKQRAGYSCNYFYPLFDTAAPAAANGAPGYAEKASPIAITDSSALNGIKWYVPPPEHLRNGMQLYFVAPQPVAAAGPDAAQELIAILISLWDSKHLLADDYIEQMSAIEHQMRALSGSKGN